MDGQKETAKMSETKERKETGETAGASERELLIREYERRLALLKSGASHEDAVFHADDLWGEVMRKCLQRAESLLEKEDAPTAATVEAVRGLAETAIALREAGRGMSIGPVTRYVQVFKDGKVRIEKR